MFRKIITIIALASLPFMVFAEEEEIPDTQEPSITLETLSAHCKQYSNFVEVVAEMKLSGVALADFVQMVEEKYNNQPAKRKIMVSIALETYKKIPAIGNREILDPIINSRKDEVFYMCYVQIANSLNEG